MAGSARTVRLFDRRVAAGVALAASLILVGTAVAAATPPQRVRDISPGVSGSYPYELTKVGTTIFFIAVDNVNGYELWKSDASAGGTTLVKDIYPGGGSSAPGWYSSELTNVGGTLYFSASDGTSGQELWKSDGTAAGTTRVKDINPGFADSWPNWLTNVGGTLYFSASNGTTGYELWKSDGTAAGTTRVKDINPGGDSSPRWFTNVGGTLYFTASNGTTGYELWKSDGTAGGTTIVKDIDTTNDNWALDVTDLINVGGTLFFSAVDDTDKGQLWKSDGTAVGTTRVTDVTVRSPRALTNVGGTLFFRGFTDTAANELWKSDGTAAGTKMVKDINPGFADSYVNGQYDRFTKVGTSVYFSASDGTSGHELWKSDGTAAGTKRVMDINPGSDDSTLLLQTAVLGGKLYFGADDGSSGSELWESDGTAAGTKRVADISPGSSGSGAGNLAKLGSTLLFQASDATSGSELWKYVP